MWEALKEYIVFTLIFVLSGLRDSRHPHRATIDGLVEPAGQRESPWPADDKPAGREGALQLQQQPEGWGRWREEEGQEEEQEAEAQTEAKGEK